VFGTERAGLRNAELDQCNALVYIPSNPEYSSLNLAMAVQVLAYEMRWAQGLDRKPVDAGVPPASATDMELFYQHLERVLLGSGFLNAGNPRNLMRRLRRLFNRARLDENELNIMRGILSALVPGSGRGDGPATGHPPEADS
jgi:TrmH family RNA methyltransferase